MRLPILFLFLRVSQGILSNVRGLERSGTNMIQDFFDQCKLPLEAHECSDLMPNGMTAFSGTDYRTEKKIIARLPFPRADQDRPCWKHFRNEGILSLSTLDVMSGGDRYSNRLIYFVTVKNPYAWIPSYCGFHLKCNTTDLSTTMNLIEEWNVYVLKWMYLQERDPDRILMVSYESILLDASIAFAPLLNVIKNEHDKTGYDCMKKGVLNLVENGKFNGRTDMNVMMSHGKRWKGLKQYYLKCEYLEKLSSEQVKIIKLKVSGVAMRELGYDSAPSCLMKVNSFISKQYSDNLERISPKEPSSFSESL